MARTIHIVGNWKMNQCIRDIRDFCAVLSLESLKDFSCEAWIAPQFIHVETLKSLGKGIKVGVQNCSEHDRGAFTGEVSAEALSDMGVHFVIIGHSERRQLYGETHETLHKKVVAATACGLTVIFCVGETLEERQSGSWKSVIEKQLDLDLKKGILDKIIIAYEPVWAIGTGKTATPAEAQEVHHFIRKTLGDDDKLIVLYGGSLNPSNARELLQCPDIDGGLVGGASLSGESFLEICKTAQSLSS